MDIDVENLSFVIGHLYDAAIDQSKWPIALRCACEFVGGAQATLFWQGVSPSEVGVFHNYNDNPLYSKLYLEKIAPLNPAFPAVLFLDVGAVLTYFDLIPLEELRETALYKEWILPQAFTDSLFSVIERDASRLAFISFPWRNGPIDLEARRRLALLVPHLQRAVAIGRLLSSWRGEQTRLVEVLENSSEAIFLLTGEGRVAFTNQQGHQLLAEERFLQNTSARLRAVEPEADSALSDALRAIENNGPYSLQGTTVALRTEPRKQWTAHMLPLGAGRGDLVEAHQAVAALYVRHSTISDPTPLQALARTHSLTASEIRVVEASLRVSGLHAISEAVGVSKSTIKTHLNRIYRKCGLRNQTELIKLVTNTNTDFSAS